MSIPERIFKKLQHYGSMLSSRQRFMFHVQRSMLTKQSRDRATRFVRHWCKQSVSSFPGDSLYFASLDHENALSNLNSNGLHQLGNILDAATIEDIVHSVRNLKAFDYLVDKAKFFGVDQLPEGARSAMFRREDLSQIDAITRIANDPKLLAVVQDYLGACPLLSNILMWWSYPAETAIGPQQFHRDVDDFKFLKMFVYLSDVDLDCGPHVYVQSSHVDGDPAMRHLRRYSDGEIQQKYGTDAVSTLQGQAGTAFLSDSFGFHKGIPPSTKPRLLLQFQWSLLPIGIETYKPVEYTPSYPYHADVNRLLIHK